jgi:hypothetical protein
VLDIVIPVRGIVIHPDPATFLFSSLHSWTSSILHIVQTKKLFTKSFRLKVLCNFLCYAFAERGFSGSSGFFGSSRDLSVKSVKAAFKMCLVSEYRATSQKSCTPDLEVTNINCQRASAAKHTYPTV